MGEFHQFLSIANASCSESKSQLYRALDYINKDSFDKLIEANIGTHKMLNSLMKYLRNSENKGVKYS
jgi:four helix bundle protein